MKSFEGKIVSLKMKNTAVVEISTVRAHPLYGRLIRRERKMLADIGKLTVALGDNVRIGETRPMSKNKHFKIMEVMKNGSA